jgi:hypothetical protein
MDRQKKKARLGSIRADASKPKKKINKKITNHTFTSPTYRNHNHHQQKSHTKQSQKLLKSTAAVGSLPLLLWRSRCRCRGEARRWVREPTASPPMESSPQGPREPTVSPPARSSGGEAPLAAAASPPTKSGGGEGAAIAADAASRCCRRCTISTCRRHPSPAASPLAPPPAAFHPPAAAST